MDGVPGLRALPPSAERGPAPVHDRDPRPPRDGARRERPAQDSEADAEHKQALHAAAQVELTGTANDALAQGAMAPTDAAPIEEVTPPPVGRRIDLRA